MANMSLHGFSKLFTAIILGASCSSVSALEIGFETLIGAEYRQNTDDADPDEGPISDTKLANGLISVFGEQRGSVLSAGFSGELETERDLDNENNTFNSVTRFIGAADLAITPRTIHWYFGDVLASVRDEDTIRISNDLSQDSRNVFITGPTYESVIQGVSATDARFFYIHQSEDNEEIESLYNFSLRHQRDTTVGSFYGVRFNDIFTSVPDDPELNPALAARAAEDFNRISLSLFNNRAREYSELYGELGATRYDSDGDTTTGLSAEIRYTRFLGPRTTLTTGVTHSLNDQRLNTIEGLLIGGGGDAGLQPEVDGIFAETRIDTRYQIDRPRAEFEIAFSLAHLGYEELLGGAEAFLAVDGDDQYQGTANILYSKEISQRWSGSLSAAFERQEHINRDDNTDALLVTGEMAYTLTRSLALEMSLTFDSGKGVRTRFTQGNDGVVVENPVDIDETETRALIGIRWAPPTRASRELTVELTSLLQ